MNDNDTVIYVIRKGKIVKMDSPFRPNSFNFLITCTYGDWSGFRTLAECESQLDELQQYTVQNASREYQIVERL